MTRIQQPRCFTNYTTAVLYIQDQLSTLARTMKATVTKNNMKEKLRAGQQYLNKLRCLGIEVKSSDVLLLHILICVHGMHYICIMHKLHPLEVYPR